MPPAIAVLIQAAQPYSLPQLRRSLIETIDLLLADQLPGGHPYAGARLTLELAPTADQLAALRHNHRPAEVA